MPACPGCGATVSAAAAFCGECGTDLEAAAEDPPGSGDRIVEGVKQRREAADDGWLGTRAKGGLYAIGGVVLLVVGYWIGFVGYTEMTMGPQGFGVYQVTYPILGIILLIFGGLAVLGGLGWLTGVAEE